MNNNYQNNGFNNQGFNNQQFNNNMQQQPQQGYPQQGQPQQQAPQLHNNINSFTIESAGVQMNNNSNSNYERNPNAQPVPGGMQVARIYKVIDIGTTTTKFGDVKRILKVSFEFPQYLQQFNLNSPELQPSSIIVDFSFFAGDKSNLRKCIHAALGRALNDNEVKGFNFADLLDKVLAVSVEQKPSKDGTAVYSNIKAFAALGAIPVPPAFQDPSIPRNPMMCFALGPNSINLTNESFANLPFRDRKMIIESVEAQSFLAGGGRVFRNSNNEIDNFYNPELAVTSNNNQQQGNFPQQTQQQSQPQFQQPQQPQNYGAFGQSAQQAFQQQPQQPQGQPQQGYNPNQQNQMMPQGQPQQQFQQQTTQQQGQQFPTNVSPNMQQAAQAFDQNLNQNYQQQAPQQEQSFQPQATGGFSMGNGDDDLPF